MTHNEMHKLMNAIMEEVISVRDEGQKEYAHDDKDVFANFNRVANLLEEDRKKVLMTYMLKHVDGIAAYVKGHKSQREDVTGRITDCMVYLMLLWGMIEEEDGTILRTKKDSHVLDVLKHSYDEDIGISVGGGRGTLNGLQPKGDLPEMRKERNGIKKSETMGTDQ